MGLRFKRLLLLPDPGWEASVVITSGDSSTLLYAGLSHVLLVAGVGRWPRGVRLLMTNAHRLCWTERHQPQLFLMKLSAGPPGCREQTG